VVGISSPLPEGDVVYVMSLDGQLICASRESGQIYWMRNLNAGYVAKRKGGFWGIGGKKVLKPVWTGPILVNNRLIVVGSTGQLVAVDAKTGEVGRKVDLGAPALIAPIAAGDMIYVALDNAQLVALR